MLRATADRPLPELRPTPRARWSRYAWPGNVRELRNVIERAVILFPSRTIGVEALPERIAGHATDVPRLGGDYTLEQIEREHVERVLARTATLDDAASILGIDLSTLYRKRKRYET